MKKLYVLLLIVPFVGFGQIVNFPDANFKEYLIINHQPVIDTNNDGEIQLSEAQAVTTLNIVAYIGYLDLTGISAFSNITELNLNALDDLNADLSALTQLTKLKITSGSLDTLTLDGLSNLKYLEFSNLFATSIVLPPLPALEELNLMSVYTLASLNIASGPSLQRFQILESSALTLVIHPVLPSLTDLTYNQTGIVYIDLSLFPNLSVAMLNYNRFTSLTAQNLPQLAVLDCNNNQITSVSVSDCNLLGELFLDRNELSSLSLDNLPNLKSLTASYNVIDSLNMGTLPELTQFAINSNQLTTLDLAFAPKLKSLDCMYNYLTSFSPTGDALEHIVASLNEITSLNLSGVPNLENLDVSFNELNELDLSASENLIVLYAQNNQLTNINLDHTPLLSALFCGINDLTALDLENVPLLQSFYGQENLFTSLDFSHQSNSNDFMTVHVNDNPVLESLIVKNQRPDDVRVENCPNLTYICADNADLANLTEIIASNEVSVNSYCNFTPGGNYNTITGTLTYDFGNNGCDVSDTHHPDLKIQLTDAAGTTGYIFTDASGNFTFYPGTGQFTILPQVEGAFTVTAQTITFNEFNQDPVHVDFCVKPVGIQYEPEITIIPIDAARPGFDANYKVVLKNAGNQVLSGNIGFQFDDAVADFISSVPTADVPATGNLSWTYSGLLPFTTLEFFVVLNINSPMETPAVNNDDILTFTATVSSGAGVGQPLVYDNFPLSQTVVGSLDPNDKTCLEGDAVAQQMIGDYLHYLIRFQNSGTFFAENVVVSDVIDENRFEIATLELTDSSHPHQTRISGNKVEFIFNGINLPAEQDNEPESHGYVAFKIKTKPDLVIGNVISNTADIFFDYNFPIRTNTAATVVSALSVGEFTDASITVYPNPTRSKVFISADSNLKSLQLFDLQGRLLQTEIIGSNRAGLDISDKASGLYLVKVISDKGSKIEKLVKE